MVRTERWKLIRCPRLPYEQLFDLRSDPAELRARLRAWQKEVRDPLLGE